MLPTRRFGRTELPMPVLSLGGMRYQQSWTDLPAEEITSVSQDHLRQVLEAAVAAGFHHIETARGYGTSERQLGELLPLVPDPRRILQTKVAPEADPARFEEQLTVSFERLAVERVDLLGLHGINTPELLEQTLRPGGCMEVARRWQAEGRIGHLGFSTHAPLPVILAAIASDAFAYINLHWYYIKQENSPALEAARAHDMGVFLISPTDKGGHLHTPSARMVELCAPHHPIVVNDLFCLSHPAVHTISVGAARVSDLELHLRAVALLEQAPALLPPILERLETARLEALGAPWLASWREGLPAWEETPGKINVPVLLWLHTLLEAWDLDDFCKARYRLLGQGGHWFPGENADALDRDVSEAELLAALAASPWGECSPERLRELRRRLGGGTARRLQVE
ncbi:MAG: aldo/keto reductase [Cyanobacteriota bacterium]